MVLNINQKNYECEKNFLKEKLCKVECPMCHSKDISILKGFSNLTFQEISGIKQETPVMTLKCNNCNYLMNYNTNNTLEKEKF